MSISRIWLSSLGTGWGHFQNSIYLSFSIFKVDFVLKIVTCIPVSFIKRLYKTITCDKNATWRKAQFAKEEEFEENLDQDEEDIEHSKVLWIRGAHRIQNQVN